MPNVEEIADWVSYSLTKNNTFLLKSKYRPVPLSIHYEIYDDSEKRYDLVEDQKVEKVLEDEPGYFGWIQNADFPLYTKKVLTAIKLRKLNNKLL